MKKEKDFSLIIFIVIIVSILFMGLMLIREARKYPSYGKVEDYTEKLATTRKELTDNIEKAYQFRIPTNIEIQSICKDIDYLVLEYDILSEAIFDSYELENIRPISGVIDQDLMIADAGIMDLKSMVKYANKDYMNKRITRLNSLIQYLNSDSDSEGMQEYLNIWWYAMGKDRENYKYIIDLINKQTTQVNADIKTYNKIWRMHVPNVDTLEPLYPYNEEYDKDYLSEEYEYIKENHVF